MLFAKTKTQLTKLLQDNDNRVIALTGKWGTGKSYLWSEIQKEATDNSIKKAIYISLFGLTDTTQIKSRLLQNLDTDEIKNIKEKTNRQIARLQSFFALFSRGPAAFETFVQMSAPSILKDRLLIIDDIERKHEKLSLDELLGFIDECSKQYGTKFLLILNTDKLHPANVWEELKEKTIDQEVMLETSPAEALSIAKTIKDSPYIPMMREPLEFCSINNIRIITKIIKITNTVLHGHEPLSRFASSRLINSVVLLVASHYQGINDGPTVDFILKKNQVTRESDSPQDPRTGDWSALIAQLKLPYTRDFEETLAGYLRTGFLDTDKCSELIRVFNNNGNNQDTRRLLEELERDLVWGHLIGESELVEKAEKLCSHPQHLSAYEVTNIARLLSDLSNGTETSDKLIKSWLSAFEKNPHSLLKSPPYDSTLDDRIITAFLSAPPPKESTTSLINCIKKIDTKGYLNESEIKTVKNAKTSDFISAMNSPDIDEFVSFIRQLIKICRAPEHYEQYHPVNLSFIKSCKEVINSDPSGRLSKILRRQFNESKIESLLKDEPERPAHA